MSSAAARPRVLVCDDEHQILRALRVILRDAGYEALPASTGEEALDIAAVRAPDAGIIDLVLPDMDGIEVCRDTQVLRAHIANLRRKIEPPGDSGGHRYIRTDPGVGYRFAG